MENILLWSCLQQSRRQSKQPFIPKHARNLVEESDNLELVSALSESKGAGPATAPQASLISHPQPLFSRDVSVQHFQSPERTMKFLFTPSLRRSPLAAHRQVLPSRQFCHIVLPIMCEFIPLTTGEEFM